MESGEHRAWSDGVRGSANCKLRIDHKNDSEIRGARSAAPSLLGTPLRGGLFIENPNRLLICFLFFSGAARVSCKQRRHRFEVAWTIPRGCAAEKQKERLFASRL